MKVKILKTVNLKKSLISDICKLKNTEWQYGISSNLKWFKKILVIVIIIFYYLSQKF